ncbi:MAG TPA: NAD-binding protein, partial [Ilumatobacteraceae bacterium]|nr:NAD-binding protein [Ilumatobacteraceae bacterium]
LVDAQLHSTIGVGVLGVLAKGQFQIAFPETILADGSVIILAGSDAELTAFDDRFALPGPPGEHSIVVGGGRVGRAAARALIEHGDTVKIIEQQRDRALDPELYVLGDAADVDVLVAAGLTDAASVLITTHDDDVNIYLALYCRRLRPDMRIVARANRDRNVSTLYRAGADDVLSYASTGSAAIWNHFRGDETLLIADGLQVFTTPVPAALVGKTLAESRLRKGTGCNVVAIVTDQTTVGNPSPTTELQAGQRLILIGDGDAEERFAERYHRRRLTLLPIENDETNEPAASH